MPTKILSFVLYVWDYDRSDIWTRYVAGLCESIRAAKHTFPGFDVVVMLADDVLPTLDRLESRWAKPLRDALQQTQMFEFSLDRKASRNMDGENMRATFHRFEPLRRFGEADIVAIRDADSPPTQADYAMVMEWWEQCSTSHPVLTYTLPLYGCNTCGGGITIARPNKTLGNVQQLLMETKVSSVGKGWWGADEQYFDRISSGVERCVCELYHDPLTYVYYTGTDFMIPVIDRLPEECDEECYWNMLQQPCRYEKTCLSPCVCGALRRRVWSKAPPKIDAIAGGAKDRVFPVYRHQGQGPRPTTYTPWATSWPSLKTLRESTIA